MREPSTRAQWSFLRRYVGLRINLFRAMHDPHFHVARDRHAVALRDGEHALVARAEFDPVLGYHYVAACGWYRSDLERVDDDEVPDAVRRELLRQFRGVLS